MDTQNIHIFDAFWRNILNIKCKQHHYDAWKTNSRLTDRYSCIYCTQTREWEKDAPRILSNSKQYSVKMRATNVKWSGTGILWVNPYIALLEIHTHAHTFTGTEKRVRIVKINDVKLYAHNEPERRRLQSEKMISVVSCQLVDQCAVFCWILLFFRCIPCS